jgi:hypothetical protein
MTQSNSAFLTRKLSALRISIVQSLEVPIKIKEKEKFINKYSKSFYLLHNIDDNV